MWDNEYYDDDPYMGGTLLMTDEEENEFWKEVDAHPDEWNTDVVHDLDDDWAEDGSALALLHFLQRTTGKQVEWFHLFNTEEGALDCEICYKVS